MPGFQVGKLGHVIVDVPIPSGKVRGIIAVVLNTPTVHVDRSSFRPLATTEQLTFVGDLASHSY